MKDLLIIHVLWFGADFVCFLQQLAWSNWVHVSFYCPTSKNVPPTITDLDLLFFLFFLLYVYMCVCVYGGGGGWMWGSFLLHLSGGVAVSGVGERSFSFMKL